MARFNTRGTRPAAQTVLTSSPTASMATKTFEGAPGHARDTKSELFIRLTSSFADQGSFYEDASKRDDRLAELVGKLAVTEDGWAWLSGFLPWLRTKGNIRTGALMASAEAVHARLAAKLPLPKTGISPRRLIGSVLQRADEPGEMIAYWHARFGRRLPKPVKRGVADAAIRLYNEKSLLKYDSDTKGVRFADVLELTHPAAPTLWQGDLFKYAIDRRHNRDDIVIPEALRTLQARKNLMEMPVEERRSVLTNNTALLAGAGMTWESLAGWLQGPMDAAAWEAIIPSMGYMAIIRNLRNFDEAGISNAKAKKLAEKIADPAEVVRSKQFPFRFYSAYKNAPSLRWGQALEEAMDHSMSNIPELKGRTLVLIDTSGSMQSPVSTKSTMMAVTQAAIFGLALKMKNYDGVDVYGWATNQFRVDPDKGTALLSLTQQFEHMVGSVGQGTDLGAAIRATYKGHDRVVILSDFQTATGYYGGVVDAVVPRTIPVYGWNMVGYSNSALPSGGNTNRFDLAGMTDSAFSMMQQLEIAKSGSSWPWENES